MSLHLITAPVAAPLASGEQPAAGALFPCGESPGAGVSSALTSGAQASADVGGRQPMKRLSGETPDHGAARRLSILPTETPEFCSDTTGSAAGRSRTFSDLTDAELADLAEWVDAHSETTLHRATRLERWAAGLLASLEVGS